jgi:hypothetical protein
MYCIAAVRVHSEWTPYEVQFALFKVTRELIDFLDDCDWEVQTMDPKPFSVTFSNFTPDFLEWPTLEDEDHEWLQELYDTEIEDGYCFLEELPEFLKSWSDNAARVEIVLVKFYRTSPGEFFWTGYLKHTDITFSTAYIKITDLEDQIRPTFEEILRGKTNS